MVACWTQLTTPSWRMLPDLKAVHSRFVTNLAGKPIDDCSKCMERHQLAHTVGENLSFSLQKERPIMEAPPHPALCCLLGHSIVLTSQSSHSKSWKHPHTLLCVVCVPLWNTWIVFCKFLCFSHINLPKRRLILLGGIPIFGWAHYQGRPNPNPMSAKLHRFATKIAVRDSFALGLEQFESKKLAKVRTTLQKEKYFKNIVHFVLCNSTQSPIT